MEVMFETRLRDCEWDISSRALSNGLSHKLVTVRATKSKAALTVGETYHKKGHNFQHA